MLRGWEGMSYALVNTKNSEVHSVTEQAYCMLCLCNAQVDFDQLSTLLINDELIENLRQEGVIEPLAEPSDLPEYQQYRLFPFPYMGGAYWCITGKCNMKCRHCFLSAPEAKYGELSREACMSIIRQLAEVGVPSVDLSGGDPLTRDDFFGIVDALRAERIVISSIYTNGMLVTQGLLDGFWKRGIKPVFMLSFDGVGWHDWLRGIRGAEAKTLEVIELLRKNDFPVGVEMVVHANNVRTLYSTVELLAGNGVEFMKVSPVSESGDWRREGGAFNLAADALYEAYLEFIPRYLRAGSPMTVQLGNFFICKKRERDYVIPLKRFNGTDKALDAPVCGSARYSVQISADGKLLSCIPMVEFPEQGGATDVLTTPLSEALHDSPYFRRVDTRLRTLLESNAVCGACEFRLVCGGGCRARAVAETGDYLGIDADACRFFKGGYEDKIKAVARV